MSARQAVLDHLAGERQLPVTAPLRRRQTRVYREDIHFHNLDAETVRVELTVGNDLTGRQHNWVGDSDKRGLINPIRQGHTV